MKVYNTRRDASIYVEVGPPGAPLVEVDAGGSVELDDVPARRALAGHPFVSAHPLDDVDAAAEVGTLPSNAEQLAAEGTVVEGSTEPATAYADGRVVVEDHATPSAPSAEQVVDGDAQAAQDPAGEPAADEPTADEPGAGPGPLRGEALDAALRDAGLSTSGTADEKRARLAANADASA